jgi:hypothetical protein
MKVKAKFYALPKRANADVKAMANKWYHGKITYLNLLVTPQVATILYDDEAVESDVVFSNVKVFM